MMDRRRFLALGSRALIGGIAAHATGSLAHPPAHAQRSSREGAAAGTAAGALAQETAVSLPVLDKLQGRATGRVAIARDLIPAGRALASSSDALPAERVRERLEAAMRALLGNDPWPQLVRPDDTVAIKINGLAAGRLSPRPELVEAIARALIAAGVAPGRIIVWDRTSREVEGSGFPLQTADGAVRHYGTDALRDGYGRDLETSGSVGSLVTRILREYATVLVNVGVLKDHDLCGVSAGMKNLYGAIHNPNRYHANGCDPFVAEVAALPSIRARLALTVIDGAIAQAEAGPAFAPAWIWPCDALLAACDPVACDRAAWGLIEARRGELGLPSLAEAGRAPRWIETGARLGLGRAEGIARVEV